MNNEVDRRVTVSVQHTVEVPENQMVSLATRVLYNLVSPGEYIVNEKGKALLKYDDPDHRHGSISEITLREATEADLAVFYVLNMIRKKYSKENARG